MPDGSACASVRHNAIKKVESRCRHRPVINKNKATGIENAKNKNAKKAPNGSSLGKRAANKKRGHNAKKNGTEHNRRQHIGGAATLIAQAGIPPPVAGKFPHRSKVEKISSNQDSRRNANAGTIRKRVVNVKRNCHFKLLCN